MRSLDIFSEFTRDENHAVLMSSHIVSDLEKSVIISPFFIRADCSSVKKRTG